MVLVILTGLALLISIVWLSFRYYKTRRQGAQQQDILQALEIGPGPDNQVLREPVGWRLALLIIDSVEATRDYFHGLFRRIVSPREE